jgi:lysophospholipase
MLVCLALLAGCRADPGYPKEAALDLDALPGPAASDFSSEATLEARWASTLEPFYRSGSDGRFRGVGGAELAYHVQRAPAPRGKVVLLAGRTEPVLKYAELVAEAVGLGYSVYALDLRGQGASARLLDNPDKGYVEYFEDYVSDVDQFVREVVAPDGPQPIYLLAHSMGGGVAVLYVDAHPDAVRAVALSAPMIEIDTGAFPGAVAFTLAATDCSVSDGTRYAIGSGDFMEETDFTANRVTHSEARWRWYGQLLRDHPELRLGGVTYRWVCEALTATSRAERAGRFSNVPTLILQAGDDRIVKPGGQERYCADAARCQLHRFAEARHEVLQERDDLRNQALSYAFRFFQRWERP